MKVLEHSYTDLDRATLLRGNLHTHTTRSDGKRSPQEVIDDYAARGYGFLMFSDHEVCTTQADYAAWDARGLVLIPGNEISAGGPHLLHVGAESRIEPDPQRQIVLNRIAAGKGFVIVNHPNWQSRFDHCSILQMMEWSGYLGMEIYNGVIGRLDGSPYALEKWDMLLSAGRRIWGFANDDSHRTTAEVGLGWNVAWVKEQSVKGVMEALTAGRFYASTGVTITRIAVDGLRICVETENAARIAAVMQVGKRFTQVDERRIEVEVPDTAKYVRFECWGVGEQMAWTQPFFVVDRP